MLHLDNPPWTLPLRLLWCLGLCGSLLGLLACTLPPASRHLVSPPAAGAPFVAEVLERIAFGSCNREWAGQPLWTSILATQPQLWIWMGDNIYADTEDMLTMRQKYAQQLADKGYRQLRAHVPVIGTWDDHDYGANDSGKDYPKKDESQQLLLDFLGVATTDPRRQRAGVYGASTYGPVGQQIKILLLDVRYHRDAPRTNGDMLGEAQWRWLQDELRTSTAQLHVIVSSTQVIPEEHRGEKWADYPQARQRLLRLIGETGAPGVIFLSGDRHHAEISRLEASPAGYPLYEITSSGLTHTRRTRTPPVNRHRLGPWWPERNFGLLVMQWHDDPVLSLQIRDRHSHVRVEQRLPLRQLQRAQAS